MNASPGGAVIVKPCLEEIEIGRIVATVVTDTVRAVMQRGDQVRLAETGDISGRIRLRGGGGNAAILGLLEEGAVEGTGWEGIGS